MAERSNTDNFGGFSEIKGWINYHKEYQRTLIDLFEPSISETLCISAQFICWMLRLDNVS